MSGEWGEAVEALAAELWHDSNPGMPVRDCDAWQECVGMARRALGKAAPLVVADTRRKVAEELLPVLVTHQRHRGGCLCGWNELGRCHAKHIIAAWEAATHEEDMK